MNLKQMIEFFRIANCLEAVKALEKAVEAIKSETCEVCTHGEDYGCFIYSKHDILHEKKIPCEVGEFLGETPY